MIIRVQNRLSPLVKIDIASWLHAEHKKKILKQRLIVFITKLTLSTRPLPTSFDICSKEHNICWFQEQHYSLASVRLH